MFAYLVIGFEIAILYTVFWYVFLREVKPHRVSGNPWGQYRDLDAHPDGCRLAIAHADGALRIFDMSPK